MNVLTFHKEEALFPINTGLLIVVKKLCVCRQGKALRLFGMKMLLLLSLLMMMLLLLLPGVPI